MAVSMMPAYCPLAKIDNSIFITDNSSFFTRCSTLRQHQGVVYERSTNGKYNLTPSSNKVT